MGRYTRVRMLAALCLVGLVLGWGADAGAKELVSNPTFEAEDKEKLPAGWSVWKPVWEKAACRVRSVSEGLLIDGPRDPYAVGGAIQEIKDIKGGQGYGVKAICRLQDIPAPYGSVLMRVSWTREGKLVHPAGMLVRGPIIEGDSGRFDDVLAAPDEADGARLSLEVRWPHGGWVL